MISLGEQRTALYRFYDADERLLYVGITNDPWRRWRQHVQEKAWYPQVKHQAVTWYDSRITAEMAERVAIRHERPCFNIAGAVRPVEEEAPEMPEEEASADDLALAAEPEPAKSVDPELNRRRTALAVAVRIAWAFLPSMPGLPSWRNPAMVALVVSTIIPVLAFTLICAASGMHRFGYWLDRTFSFYGTEQQRHGEA